MKPIEVNPRNFKIDCILYESKDFSVAYGIWEGDSHCVAMRWNGENGEAGYPKVFGNPMWFILCDEIKIPLLKSLIGLEKSNNHAILESIKNEL